MSNIATLEEVSAAMGTAAKFLRVMAQGGATLESLQQAIDDPRKRRRMIAYMAAGYPKIELPELSVMAPVIAVNQHGHTTVTFTGLDLSGAEEIDRAQEQGNRVGDYAQSMLTSTKADSYDANHRLVAGQSYTAVLMPNSVISKDRERTTANLCKVGHERFGYGKPLAGFAPRIREHVSDEMLEKLGFWYAAVLHDPITDRDGDPYVLNADRIDGGRWLYAFWVRPEDEWDAGGASVLSVPAS